ncbi:DUF2865 domain-containing protein [Mesorhizobium sp. NBSH29]|uniref:DUF2865 domain-containing protein n=1 Tax=Mesorhizobium sp. NBSH29 TaxID=2654249 RepID=UPI0018968999|nr:DUF2865 domain-containing protein [Mesorhizobium sp. NBSH29]QPC86976.1 DUF2865 domain-containing protein [Mesorhizobium sp. NBSH29]
MISTKIKSIKNILRAGVTISLVFMISLFPSPVLAQSCSDLKAQLLTAGKSSARNVDPSLLRQLSALRGLERARQCSSKKSSGGLFDPCRELSQRRASVQRQIDQTLGGGANVSQVRSRYAALGCEDNKLRTASTEKKNSLSPLKDKRPEVVRASVSRKASIPRKQEPVAQRQVERQKMPEKKDNARASSPHLKPAENAPPPKVRQKREAVQAPVAKFRVKGTMLFCVRLKDGYYFPAPNSQFVGLKNATDTLDRCRYICESEDVAVYKLEDMALETEDMQAVDGGIRYADLPNAFAYRDAVNFKSCDFDGYQDRIAEMKARTVTPSNMSAAIIPLPTRRPNIAGNGVDESPAFPGIDPTTTADANVPKRNIRVILPTYIMPAKAMSNGGRPSKTTDPTIDSSVSATGNGSMAAVPQ